MKEKLLQVYQKEIRDLFIKKNHSKNPHLVVNYKPLNQALNWI